MLLSLLKLNVVANVEGKRWFGHPIYGTHGVQEPGGKLFSQCNFVRSMALGCKNRALWCYAEKIYIYSQVRWKSVAI